MVLGQAGDPEIIEILLSGVFQSSGTQKIFFNHGESIPQQSLEIIHSGAFQSSKTRNFLQPW